MVIITNVFKISRFCTGFLFRCNLQIYNIVYSVPGCKTPLYLDGKGKFSNLSCISNVYTNYIKIVKTSVFNC